MGSLLGVEQDLMTPVCDTDKLFYCVGARTAIGIQPADSGERFVEGRVGLHHLCLRARSREDIDRLHDLLREIGAAIIHELLPKATTIGVLLDPTFSSVDMQLAELQTAARATGHELRVLNVSTDAEIDEAFSILVKTRAGGLVVGGNPFLNGKRNKLIALAASETIPAIYEARESTIAGGLMSYGPSITDVYRRLGVYAGRILKGEKPSDLPVLQPTKFELLINLKTARALGLEVPPRLLARADEVIE